MSKIYISIFSFIVGFLLSQFIVDFHAPNSKDVIHKIFIDENGRKYRLIPKVYMCPTNI